MREKSGISDFKKTELGKSESCPIALQDNPSASKTSEKAANEAIVRQKNSTEEHEEAQLPNKADIVKDQSMDSEQKD